MKSAFWQRTLPAAAAAGLFVLIPTFASADHLEQRIARQFPLAASSLETTAHRAAHSDSIAATAVRDFNGASFAAAYRLENGAVSVSLRPITATRAAAHVDGNATAYDGAFRGVDALRTASRELLWLADADSARMVAYEVAASKNIQVVATEGRGVRFVALPGAGGSIRLSAPLLIDSVGRPSMGAFWQVERENGITRLRLRVTDPNLRYPVLAMYAPGAASAAASLKPAVNSGTGSIAGRLTDASTGSGLPDEIVYVFTSTGDFENFSFTDSAGNYNVGGLGTGNFRALVAPSGYQAQMYNGINCPNGCDVTTATNIAVIDDTVHANINFAVSSQYARVRGTVRDAAGVPLPDMPVAMFDASGAIAGGYTVSNFDGTYESLLTSPGTYYAKTVNTTYEGYVDELYPNINCTGCNVTSGTAFNLVLGDVRTGVDFSIATNGGRISGTITDAATGNPIGFQNVIIYGANGQPVAFASADENGNYLEFAGLAAGNYYATASASEYDTELYNNINCAFGCTVTSGTAIAVTLGSTRGSTNFSLSSSVARIAGTVRDASTNAPIGGILVAVYDANGRNVTTATSDNNDGTWNVELAQPGTYYARTLNNTQPDYLEQLYDRIDCSGCSVTSGTGIVATRSTPTTGIDFALHKNGGTITGRVFDGGTNDPIAFAHIQVFSGTGEQVTASLSDVNGNWMTFNGLATGTYYAVAGANQFDNQLYHSITCANGCTPSSGTAIHVTQGQNTPDIDFPLASTSARIAGKVIAADTSAALPGVTVLVYNSSGVLSAVATTDGNGNYVATVQASGNYYAKTDNNAFPNYGDQLYDHLACPGGSCNPLGGTAIAATTGSVASGINFALPVNGCATIDLDPPSLPDASKNSTVSVQFTATGATPTVTFAVVAGSLPPGISLTSSGLYSGTYTTAGSYSFTIRATGGDSCQGARSYDVDVTNTPTTTTLTSSASTAVYGTSFTLTAAVAPSSATGTVTFFDGANAIDSAPVVSGSASLNVTTLVVGSHELTAAYSGDSQFASSVSPEVVVTITKATPVITWPDPAAITYGTALSSLQLNASTPVLGTFVYSPPAGTVLNAGTQTLSVAFTPNDTANYNNASATATLVVNKATPVITWPAPAPITYPTALSSTQLNATANVAGSFVYTPAAGTVLNAGTQTLTADFTPTDTANYNNATATVTLVVNASAPAITWAVPNPITYGTPLSSTQLNATAAQTGTFTYDPAAGTILNAGSNTLSVHFVPDDTNFLPADASVTLVVNKATPAFSNLSSPNIAVGAASTAIGGTISFGSFIPTGTVSITLNGVTQTAVIQADGSFSSSFATGSLAIGTYPISFSYGGDGNFNGATGSSSAKVGYGVTGGHVNPPTNSGSTAQIRIQLVNAAGANVSSASKVVTAYGIRLATSSTWLPATSANGSTAFQFQNASGGQYKFDLKTTGLAPGTYVLGFTVTGDPTIHEVTVVIN